MERQAGAPAAPARRPVVTLALPRFDLARPGATVAAAATVQPPPPAAPPRVTPTPPVEAVVPRAAGAVDTHAHAHGHGHAHGHAHAHSHEPRRSHGHGHAHGGAACDGSHGLFDAHHHDWSHLAMQPRSRRMLTLALALQLAFLVVEVVGGIVTNSLALLGDAAHMLADVGALSLALLAANLAARAIDARRTWGIPRAEVLAALVNSITLVLSCAWIAYEAIRRLVEPEQVAGPGLVAVAAAGLVANLVGAWLLAQADRENVNIRAAMAHLLVDAASSVGVIVAGIVIALGGPVLVDTAASLLIAVVAVRGTWPVLRAALDSLVDAAPAGVDATDVVRVLSAAPAVTGVHDVHVWEPGPRRIAATAHVLVDPAVDVGGAIVDLRGVLVRELGIDHVTLQVAPDRRRALLELEPRRPRDLALRRAEALVARARPAVDRHRIAQAVAAGACHASEEAVVSPVRLAASALRAL